MRRLQVLLSVLLLFFSAESFAQSDVDSLRIDVKLLDNGSAEVTEIWYIDVSDNITEESTFKREIDPLLKIKDGYPKLLLARTGHDMTDYEGIKIVDVAQWLMEIN